MIIIVIIIGFFLRAVTRLFPELVALIALTAWAEVALICGALRWVILSSLRLDAKSQSLGSLVNITCQAFAASTEIAIIIAANRVIGGGRQVLAEGADSHEEYFSCE